MLTSRLPYRRILSRISSRVYGLRRASPSPTHTALLHAGFVFGKPPTRECHASTIAIVEGTPVAAWFGGSAEGHTDVSIWAARCEGDGWGAPAKVAEGLGEGGPWPCWNPVLFRTAHGALLLFYKVGPNPRQWWGMVMRSGDGARTWSAGQRLPPRIYGPIKNKPIQLSGGDILSPSSEEHGGWKVHLERSRDGGESWTRTPPLDGGGEITAIQPSILHYPDGRLQVLCRTKQRWVAESWSLDDGLSWSALSLLPLPNPNSGNDALTLNDGRQLLVYNPSRRNRWPLVIALSEDGRSWRDAVVLERGPGEYSYPAVVQGEDGRVHVTYTWNLCRIRYVVLEPTRL